LVAACGGYCGGCTDYLAYINNDEKLKRKLAEEFSRQFDRDINLKTLDVWVVTVQYTNLGVQAVLSDNALKKRGILTCAFCDEFPCEKLEKYYEKDKCGDKFRAHILGQKEIGLERWLEQMKKKTAHKSLVTAETAGESEIKFVGM